MRVIFGVLSLLIAVAVIGVLAKKQLAAVATPVAVPGAVAPAAPGATPRQQSEQMQQQVRQTVEGLMQQARPMPDDK
ncbi:hypothetical protein [Variovorax terrae]|uniref:Uncharacterized protein n=1 Tax=Variovorax terrae TaxID=2923278 RepID=A0A9X2AP88_9BURK|nr:hypothetical protein [Variovorax terrae]MCJ0763222.1 hypothetical protein [Variovorax terrae]